MYAFDDAKSLSKYIQVSKYIKVSKYIQVSKYIKDHTEVKFSNTFQENFTQLGLI